MNSAQERRNYIVKQTEKNGAVRISALSKELCCSEVTIRNDIRKLDQQGFLRKVHGGAQAYWDELSVAFARGNYFLHKAEKTAIAAQAYKYIAQHDSIIIDNSTSGYYLARLLRHNTEKHVTVVTNSILCAAELSNVSHIELFIVSGRVIGTPPAALDIFTVEALAQFNANKAFIGVSSLDLNKGPATFEVPQRDIKRAMVNSAKETCILADHTKFNGNSLFSICPISSITRIITDSKVSPEMIAQAAKLNLLLDVV